MTPGSARVLRWALGPPSFFLVSVWVVSVAVLAVMGVWDSIVIRMWQPLVLALIAACVQAALAAVAWSRVKKASSWTSSWWAVVVVGLAVPLVVFNLAIILATAQGVFRGGG
jgi:hypothetical protein